MRRTTEEHLSSGEQPSAALAAQAAKAAATAANTAHAITNIFVIRNGTVVDAKNKKSTPDLDQVSRLH